VHGDEWLGRLRRDSSSTYTLEIRLDGAEVGRVRLTAPMSWVDQPREGVSVRWSVNDGQASVAVSYEGRGTVASIRANSGQLEQWELGADFQAIGEEKSAS
jgi:hypothetical protein